jgi:hypothetical protein
MLKICIYFIIKSALFQKDKPFFKFNHIIKQMVLYIHVICICNFKKYLDNGIKE